MNLFRTIEEHIFTLAFGAFHNYSVIAFAVNADPYSAEIASPAEQQPSEPGENAPMPVRNLRGRVLFPFGRTSPKGKFILFTGQTLFAPFLKASIRLMAPNREKVNKKLPYGHSRTTFPLIGPETIHTDDRDLILVDGPARRQDLTAETGHGPDRERPQRKTLV